MRLDAKARRPQQRTFCSATAMTATCGSAVGRGYMSRCTKTFRAWKQEGRAKIFDAAMARVRQWIPEKADRMAKAAETPQRKTAVWKAAHQEEEWKWGRRRGSRLEQQQALCESAPIALGSWRIGASP